MDLARRSTRRRCLCRLPLLPPSPPRPLHQPAASSSSRPHHARPRVDSPLESSCPGHGDREAPDSATLEPDGLAEVGQPDATCFHREERPVGEAQTPQPLSSEAEEEKTTVMGRNPNDG